MVKGNSAKEAVELKDLKEKQNSLESIAKK
jgi:hypothetical protein